eukprot:572078-Rhodomonas_salina.3
MGRLQWLHARNSQSLRETPTTIVGAGTSIGVQRGNRYTCTRVLPGPRVLRIDGPWPSSVGFIDSGSEIFVSAKDRVGSGLWS